MGWGAKHVSSINYLSIHLMGLSLRIMSYLDGAGVRHDIFVT